LVEDVVALTIGSERRNACEVFHCSGGLGVAAHELMVRFAAAAGVRLSFGRPVTPIEQKFGRAIELNMPFANTEWQFVRTSLDRVLGRAMPPDVLTRSDFSHMIAWYLEQDLHEVEASAILQ
jgi:hypothetical protein